MGLGIRPGSVSLFGLLPVCDRGQVSPHPFSLSIPSPCLPRDLCAPSRVHGQMVECSRPFCLSGYPAFTVKQPDATVYLLIHSFTELPPSQHRAAFHSAVDLAF